MVGRILWRSAEDYTVQESQIVALWMNNVARLDHRLLDSRAGFNKLSVVDGRALQPDPKQH